MKNNIQKPDFKSFFSNLKEHLLQNKKYVLITLISFLVIILIVLILTICLTKKDNDEYGNKLYFSEELLVPDGPETTEEYKTTRQTNETWTKEETDEWFTLPTTKEINILEKENEQLVLDLLGAAP